MHTHTCRISYIHMLMNRYTHSHKKVHIKPHTKRLPRHIVYQFYKESCAAEKELHLKQGIAGMVGTWVSRTLFSMRWARVWQQSPALKTGARGSYWYSPRSRQMQYPEELHLTLVQGRRGNSKAKRTQRDEMRLTPQSRGAARCDESFEETRNSLGKKVVFSSLEKRQKGVY